MIVRYLKQKFSPRLTDNAGKPISRTWIGDRDEAVLVDIDSGKVHAHVSHDGYGKYFPTVYTSPFRALGISRRNEGFLISLRALPRCTCELLRLRSMEAAKSAAEDALQSGP